LEATTLTARFLQKKTLDASPMEGTAEMAEGKSGGW
jgi:hypothetical protein